MKKAHILLLTCQVLTSAGFTYKPLKDLEIQAGDLVITKEGRQFFATSDSDLAAFQIPKICFLAWRSTIWVAQKSDFSPRFLGRIAEVDHSHDGGFSPKVGAAVARKLVGKELPYNTLTCSPLQYLTYFLHGRVVSTRGAAGLNGYCPLARNLDDIDVEEVEKEDFYLEDPSRNPYKISELREYKPISIQSLAIIRTFLAFKRRHSVQVTET